MPQEGSDVCNREGSEAQTPAEEREVLGRGTGEDKADARHHYRVRQPWIIEEPGDERREGRGNEGEETADTGADPEQGGDLLIFVRVAR